MLSVKKNKEKRKQKNNSNALAEDGLEMMLSSIKKNGLDYLQKDDFNGKLRNFSLHIAKIKIIVYNNYDYYINVNVLQFC